MKEDRILKIYGCLHLWLFTAGILLILLDVGGLLDIQSAGKLLFLFFPLLVLREVSVRGKKIWGYLGAAVLSGSIFWLLGRNLGESTCFLLGVCFFILLFFYERVSGKREAFFRPSYGCLVAFILEYIFSLAYGLDRGEDHIYRFRCNRTPILTCIGHVQEYHSLVRIALRCDSPVRAEQLLSEPVGTSAQKGKRREKSRYSLYNSLHVCSVYFSWRYWMVFLRMEYPSPASDAEPLNANPPVCSLPAGFHRARVLYFGSVRGCEDMTSG